MSDVTVRGIVVKETMVGEADKLITVIAKDYGKLTISAKGARRAKNKFVSGTTLFAYCDFTTYNRNTYFGLNQVDIIENFYSLTNDIYKFAYASYFAEIMDKTTQESQNVNDVLFLFLKTLVALKNNKQSPKLIARVFEIKFLQLSGVMPEITGCSVCGKETGELYFGTEGVVCQKCRIHSLNYIPITSTVIYTIAYILNSNIDKLFNFNISDSSLDILTKVSRMIFQEHINIFLKSMQFVNNLEQL